MTLGAMKHYSGATNGRDLWCDMLHFMEVWNETGDEPLIARMRKVHSVLSFENAAHAFHSLIRGENKSIPLNEIEDAMFAVAWLPTESMTDMSEPWPFVMVDCANAITKEMADFTAKKKLAATEQSSA